MSAAAWERTLDVRTAEQTHALAAALGAQLEAGDLVVLTGELGAGKTTFTQGLGEGLGVRAGIISPTFVLVRIHPNLPDGPRPGGPDLVHVDAYRLESAAEIDDIDLENTMDSAVTVVEWGRDRVEHLSESRLEVDLHRRRAAQAPPGGAAGSRARPGHAGGARRRPGLRHRRRRRAPHRGDPRLRPALGRAPALPGPSPDAPAAAPPDHPGSGTPDADPRHRHLGRGQRRARLR